MSIRLLLVALAACAALVGCSDDFGNACLISRADGTPQQCTATTVAIPGTEAACSTSGSTVLTANTQSSCPDGQIASCRITGGTLYYYEDPTSSLSADEERSALEAGCNQVGGTFN
ncbi:MAG: hypothetical protein ACJAYU_004388 [Bradymonadia bacterium]|jgi:hypothetical protein